MKMTRAERVIFRALDEMEEEFPYPMYGGDELDGPPSHWEKVELARRFAKLFRPSELEVSKVVLGKDANPKVEVGANSMRSYLFDELLEWEE